jgi:LmeA-like phospholipid-binding
VRRIAFVGGLLLVIVLVLVIAQLLLPGIAAQQLRSRLEQSGTVLKVEVDAFPAIQLLWHHADKVVVRMRDYSSSSRRLSSTLSSIGDADSLDASADELKVGLLTLRDAALHKQGNQLTGRAMVTQSDLQSSFPVLDSLRLVDSSGGELTLQGTATVLGVTATADATVRAQNGTLVVSPDVPFGGLATITLFSSPHLEVQGVSATPAPGGFILTAQAQLK